MSAHDDEDKTIYRVVVNHEEQYSIWPTHMEIPAGWKEVGTTGTKAQCLERVKELWTDMRPLSVRQQLDAQSKNP
jgi:MbtH protein